MPTEPEVYSHVRYLAAKKTVDDRALNRRVWDHLARELSARGEPPRILELGAGIGTMVQRLVEWGALVPSSADPSRRELPDSPRRDPPDSPRQVVMTLVDSDAPSIHEARTALADWGERAGFAVDDDEGRLRLRRSDLILVVELAVADALGYVAREAPARTWDLLLANAFLDLIDVPRGLPTLFSALRPGGLFYFSINFDGGFILEPPVDRQLDDQIAGLLYEAMDSGGPSSECVNSRVGRQLFHAVRTAGGAVLDAGSSDWVVFAGPAGYEADEAYFLHHIIHFLTTTLADSPALAPGAFAAWAAERHRQIDVAELVYVSHQLDLLGRVPGA